MKTDDLILLPRPANLARKPGCVRLPSRMTLPEGLPDLVHQCAQALCSDTSGPELVVGIDSKLESPEGYRLVCRDKAIALDGGSAAGVWYGLQTLRQLAVNGKDFPCVEILDTPDFAERGFMLDISRNKVPTMESLFRLVDLLSSIKINQLQLYTEHTFAYTGHELVWGEASPMTGEQVRELDAYCRSRYIELVPNQNSFGHLERWLRWPEYQHLAESPHGWNFGDHLSKECGTVLKPNDESLAFVESLYRELLPNFSSRKFNIGCDETWELGKGWSRPQVRETNKHEVYLQFLIKLADRVKGHGRQPLFWADILLNDPESIKRLPKDMIPVIWGYEADHPFDEQCALVANSGLQYHVAPGTSTWKTLTGNLANAFPNLRNAAHNGLANGASGYLITNWGDLGHHQTWPLTLPGLAYGAALAWSGKANRDADITPSLATFVLDEPSGNLAEALMRAGSLDAHFATAKAAIADRLFQIFFCRNTNLSHHLDDMRPGLLREIDSELSAIRALASETRPPAVEASACREELILSIDMARFAIRRGLCWRELIEDGKPVPAATLRSTLQELIGRFENTWLTRNRPGGLHDSSARMRNTLSQLGPAAAPIDYNPG